METDQRQEGDGNPAGTAWRDMLDTVTVNGRVLLALGVALLAVAILTDYRELFALGIALILALVVAAMWMSLRPSIEASRVLAPARVTEGETACAVLTVKNVGRRRSTPVRADERFGGASIPIPVDSLGANETRAITYPVPTARRGRYAVGPLSIAHTDPLRLMRIGRTSGAVASLHVLPRVHEVPTLPTGRARDIEGRRSSRTSRGGITFDTLREYVPGDDLRLVHWRSTARMGKLMIRHNVITNEPRFSVLLDTWTGSYDEPESFEAAVRVAASLVDSGCDAGQEVTFRTTSGFLGRIDSTGAGRAHVFDLLAEAEASEDDLSLGSLAKTVESRKVPISLGIVTGEPIPAHAELAARAGSQFQSMSVVQVRATFERGPLPINSALVMQCHSSEQFATMWKQQCG